MITETLVNFLCDRKYVLTKSDLEKSALVDILVILLGIGTDQLQTHRPATGHTKLSLLRTSSQRIEHHTSLTFERDSSLTR